MANISELIAKKNEQDQQRREANKEERANLSELRNAVLTEITSNPASFSQYLDLQANNVRCSAGNVALAMVQLQSLSPTVVGTKEFWRNHDRSILRTELQGGARVFVRPKDSKYHGYLMGDYYDITQTTGKPFPEQPALNADFPRLETAIVALMECCPVPVVESQEIEGAARYDQDKMVLAINTNYTTMEILAILPAEVAYARLHDRGYNSGFDRGGCKVNAEAAGYMFCKRFGIECQPPDVEAVPAFFEGRGVTERGEALDGFRSLAADMGDAVYRAIRTPQRTQNRGNGAR